MKTIALTAILLVASIAIAAPHIHPITQTSFEEDAHYTLVQANQEVGANTGSQYTDQLKVVWKKWKRGIRVHRWNGYISNIAYFGCDGEYLPNSTGHVVCSARFNVVSSKEKAKIEFENGITPATRSSVHYALSFFKLDDFLLSLKVMDRIEFSGVFEAINDADEEEMRDGLIVATKTLSISHHLLASEPDEDRQ